MDLIEPAALRFEEVTKQYPGTHRAALERVSIAVPRGSRVAVVGRSGSGKSTFLHLAAGVDVPTSGRVEIDGRDLFDLTERDRTLLRRDHVGLVFQFFHLLPHLSILENTLLPAMIAADASLHRTRALKLLERVGLRSRAHDPAEKLSGGEMQRVAICRALLRRPRILLADEPTGNLDDATGRTVMALLLELVREETSTLVFVTHSLELAEEADLVLELHSGNLAAQTRQALSGA